ncbi:hypothetical protein ACVW1A_007265 [Bradyrhizobium sp. LB1.3]
MAFCQTEKLGAATEHEWISIDEKRAGRRSPRCAKAVKIEAMITEEVSARRLTNEPIAKIGASLKGKIDRVYLYALADVEANRYAFQIS